MSRQKIQIRLWLRKPINENQLVGKLIQLHWDTSDIDREQYYIGIEVRQYNSATTMINKTNELIP